MKIDLKDPEAVFLVMCDPSMNELRATLTSQCTDLYGSRSLTAHSQKGRTQLKIRPLGSLTNLAKLNKKVL
jgi:hypothetical protein